MSKRKDGICGTGRKRFVTCGENCWDSYW